MIYMKRVVIYSILFCVSFIVLCATIVKLNFIFWLSALVMCLSGYLMERDYKQLEGEIDDIYGTDDDFE